MALPSCSIIDATLDAFRRFSSIVMAYSFTDDQTEEVCMVPVADILNHVTGKNNARLFYNDDNLQVRRNALTTHIIELDV